MQDVQDVQARDAHLQELETDIIQGRLHKKEDMTQDIQKYWPIRHELAMIDGVTIKGKQIIIPSQLQMQILNYLLGNHMGI